MYGSSSSGLAEKIETQRLKKVNYTQQRRQLPFNYKKSAPKTKANELDENYGTDTCSRPDLSDELFTAEQNKVLAELEQNCNKRLIIESRTVDQSSSNEWLEIRQNMLTSSLFGKICKRKSKFGTLVKQIFKSKNMSPTVAMKHGMHYEKVAREKLEKQLNIKVKESGILIDQFHYFLGSSPDGLIDEDGLVEIKCPFSSFGMKIDDQILARKITCYSVDKKTKEISVNRNHEYFYQIQGQLNIFNRKYCLFVHYSGDKQDLKITKIERDQVFWDEKMVPALKQFFFKHYLPELADPRLARGMDPR